MTEVREPARPPMKAKGLLILSIVLLVTAGQARAERIFYRSSLWLESSSSVQHLSLVGVLRAWERLARAAETERLPYRQQEFARLHRCLVGSAFRTQDLLDRLTVFSFSHLDRSYYSLTDFVAEGLRELCDA